MEKMVKSHYRKTANEQPPENAVLIPPLTAEQHAALKNWNTAAQVGVYGITAGSGAIIGAGIDVWIGGSEGAIIGGMIGAVSGVMWGAYEAICIASVQDEFDEASKQGSGITVWRESWKFNVDANSHDGSYTQANGLLSALFVAATMLVMTGKIP